jgi:hypothetical protein
VIELIYAIFSGWFVQKSPNESQWNRVMRGFIGVTLIISSISLAIFLIYLSAKQKNAT